MKMEAVTPRAKGALCSLQKNGQKEKKSFAVRWLGYILEANFLSHNGEISIGLHQKCSTFVVSKPGVGAGGGGGTD